MQLQGLHDGGPESPKHWDKIHAAGKTWYETQDRGEDLVLKRLPGDHVFLDEFKRQAYSALNQHFKMTSSGERLSLSDLVRPLLPKEHAAFQAEAEHFVIANRQALGRALGGIFYALSEKMLPESEMVVSLNAGRDEVVIVIQISHAADSVPVPHGYKIRDAEQVFVEHGGTLTHGDKGEGIEYRIAMRKAD